MSCSMGSPLSGDGCRCVICDVFLIPPMRASLLSLPVLTIDKLHLTLRLSRARKPQRRRSGATVLVVKGALYIFLALHLLRLPRRPMLQHGVKNSQQLMHARRQGDFFDVPRREEPFVKDFDLRVEARGHQRAPV